VEFASIGAVENGCKSRLKIQIKQQTGKMGPKMVGITEIIAGLAFLIALAGLWLVSEASKKVEENNKRILETYIKPMKSSIKGAEDKVRKLTERLSLNEKNTDKTAANAMETLRALEALSKEFGKLSSDLGKVSGAVPNPASSPRPGAPAI